VLFDFRNIGAKLEHFKKNWNSTKISVTTRMHLTRGGCVQSPLTSGPRRWSTGQTPWLAGPILLPLVGLLHGHALQEAVTRNPKLKVSGSRTRWSAGHMASSVGHHLAPNQPLQVIGGPIHPYKCPPHGESRDTTLYL
jgi:hypothetical protein